MNIAYAQKMSLRLAILATTSFIGQAALAACPDISSDPLDNVGRVNIPGSYPETVFFCKQNFASANLTFSPNPNTILPGGSQVISMGSKTQTSPIQQNIQIQGFIPNNLNINLNSGNLSALFPSSGGYKNSPSLFNFYTKIAYASSCLSAPRGGNQYDLLKNYLRDNPNIFTLIGQSSVPQRLDNSPQDIVIFKNAQLINKNNPNQKIIADITLYHASQNVSDAFFETGFLQPKYCWLGIGARVDLKNMNLSNTGNYDLTLAVNTQ
ncbi:hypothetical protein [Psychrobacter phenylpyruvicus]|uniref:Uncharacterized protein n=1 Tax=Psychrobacter phenylpyruvicus TaxID=29432 RepID=A0A379LLL9_9GAMM|nr:hypothetical protein [Psychrobacter phenylpyruvicus]SUD91509.1 Uncharacterised protein [Psychrobacter phenylpyruvicus]